MALRYIEDSLPVTTHPASIPLVSTIFTLTYLALALGRIPGLRIDRAGIALVGAAAMLACGVVSMHDAAKAVDYETIVLLFGMMVVVAYLRLAGFFRLATDWIAGPFFRAVFFACGDDLAVGRPVGVSGQRRRLRGPDAPGTSSVPATQAPADSLLGGPGDRFEYWLRRDDHGESAKYHHRFTVTNLVPAFRGAAGPDRLDRPCHQLRRRGSGLRQDDLRETGQAGPAQ